MCLSDPDTAILIGGETADQNYCQDSLWKFELGQWSLLNYYSLTVVVCIHKACQLLEFKFLHLMQLFFSTFGCLTSSQTVIFGSP